VRREVDKLTIEEMTEEIILEQLHLHLNQGRPVILHNTFQGVPIVNEATVAMIHPEYIGVVVHPYQTVCIREERRTYLESKLLPGLIRAYPVSIDYTNQVVVLKRLQIPKSITPDLAHSWVAPEKPIMVTITSAEQSEMTVDLAEIAVLEENQIRIGLFLPEDNPFARQDEVVLSFLLASSDRPVVVKGVVHSLAKMRNRHQRRMEVAGRASMEDEISLLAFVGKREDQILRSLDKSYKKLRKAKKR